MRHRITRLKTFLPLHHPLHISLFAHDPENVSFLQGHRGDGGVEFAVGFLDAGDEAVVAVADGGVADCLTQERGGGGYGDAAQDHLAAVVAVVFQVDGAGFQALPEFFQVGVGADDLQAVLREDAVAALGDVDSQAAAEDGYDMDAEALAEVQFHQGFPAPVDLRRNVEVGEVHILGQQV